VADLGLPDDDAVTACGSHGRPATVTYTADVRTPDNQVTKKTLVLTFQRVLLKDTAGKIKEGNWMITGLKDAGAGQ
jgi:hypothetical protein